MKKIAIIDDEINILTLLEQYINQYDEEIEVLKFSDKKTFFDSLDKITYDVIILDIFLQNSNGIDISNKLNTLSDYKAPYIILISGKPKETFDVYDTDHFYFLEKPINKERLFKALQKADNIINAQNIKISYNKENIKLNLLDIIYVESDRRKLSIVLKNKIYHTYMKLDDFEELTSSCFLRVSQSFLVNTKYIKTINNRDVIMNNGLKILISKKYFENVLNWRNKHDLC